MQVIRLFAVGYFEPEQLQRRDSAMKTPSTPNETPEPDLEQQKQLIAYQLWEDDGCPEGRAEEHWQQACLVVMSLGEGETATPPLWLKRQDEPTVEQPTVVENLGKRSASRRAA